MLPLLDSELFEDCDSVLFISSLKQYLLSTYYVPGTVLGTGIQLQIMVLCPQHPQMAWRVNEWMNEGAANGMVEVAET